MCDHIPKTKKSHVTNVCVRGLFKFFQHILARFITICTLLVTQLPEKDFLAVKVCDTDEARLKFHLCYQSPFLCWAWHLIYQTY